MALNIKNHEVEQLAAEVAALGASSKTEALKQALIRERARLQNEAGLPNAEQILRYLEQKVWPYLPPGASVPLTREQEDEILGYGPEGVPM